MTLLDDTAQAEQALSREARPAWHLLVLVACIVGALVAMVQIDARLARVAASEVMAPTQALIEHHIIETREARKVIEDFAAEEKRTRNVIAENQYRMCLKLGIDCKPVQ